MTELKDWLNSINQTKKNLIDEDPSLEKEYPPYDIKDNLYGKKGAMHKKFDHDKFAEDCSNSSVSQMVSYNSYQLVKDRFKDWNATEFDLTYTMRSVGQYMREQKERKELLLLNYGIEGLA